ncbi:MAG: carboxypeptidase-like regulatory domain-containing protein [Terriglobales bacterium]
MKKLYALMVLCGFFAVASLGLRAQSNPTGSLSGVVTDPSGAAIPGASLVITDNATHHAYNLQSDVTGRYALSNLSPDVYTVVVSHQGFQSGRYNAVTIQVGQTYTLNAKLKVGEATQTVEVQAGQQVLETQSTSVSTQITGQQITQIPIASRNSQDLAIIEPGTQTTGSPRASQFNGLPPGAINLTFDGINSQDNVLKSSNFSAFFSTEQPRLDDVQEMNISTAATDAASNGEGAVQVAFVSKKGTNQFHGGGWEYLRNNDLNANYYFNNEANPSLPRQRIDLNEFGYKIGGPILHNKLFFFTDMDIWENPQARLRSRNILTPAAAAGNFTYVPGTMPGSASPNAWTTCSATADTCTADLMAMAGSAANGTGTTFTSAVDPIQARTMAALAAAPTAPGVSVGASSDFNLINVNWNALAASHRRYPDIRLDYNINQTNSLEFDYHYAYYDDSPDILNSADATYPVAPFTSNFGAQISNRNLTALAWRSQLSPTINNELRVGGQSAPLWFNSGQSTAIYPSVKTDVGTLFMRPGAPGLISNPYARFNLQGRNAALGQVNETLSWLHGNHAMSIGGTFTDVRWKNFAGGEAVASVNVGINSDDPADGMFNSTNLPGIANSDIGTAANLWASLAGRVTSFSDTINANPYTRKFQANYNSLEQITQKEYSLFFSDSWHARSNVTVNYGLRWEFEQTPQDDLNLYSMPVGGGAGAYGVSGLNNLFKPGLMPAAVTSFVNDQGQSFYNSDKKDFAPSLGIAWTPATKGGMLGWLLGSGGQSVIRAGYSISYDRQGLSEFEGLAASNPGTTNSAFMDETDAGTVASSGGAASGLFQAGSLSLGSQNLANGLTGYQRGAGYAFGAPFPINSIAGDQVNAYAPGLAQPLVESWSVGFQRQLNPNTAIEIDYVGNHGMREWDAARVGGNYVFLNEVNIFENGFLNEFNAAAHNLSICQSNPSDCKAAQTAANVGRTTSNSFGDWGLAGQTATPIFSGSFNGSTANNPAAASSLFSNGGFVSDLETGQAGDIANTLGNTYGYWQSLTGPGGAGYPDNFWMANPDATGGAWNADDLNQSTYNGLQVTLRRRMADGLQFDANYAWSKALSTGDVLSLRNYGGYKAPSPEDLRNVFKLESLYELPFGAGHRLKSGNGLVNALIGGWGWDAITRWQSGSNFEITGGGDSYSVNGNSGGVALTGTDVQGIQSQLAASKLTASSGAGVVYYSPSNLQGTRRQRANFSIIGPCTTAGAFCQQPFITGPSFFKADWGIVKDTQLTEGVKLTLRANALDIFNNINFQKPSGNITRNSFMQITSGYQDFTSTQDPGGRVIEFQFRITF